MNPHSYIPDFWQRSQTHTWVKICDIWLLSLALLTQHDDLQLHPFSCKWHNSIFYFL
jgi:hypothetical protein